MFYIFTKKYTDVIKALVDANEDGENHWTVDPYAGRLNDGTYAIGVELGEELTLRGIEWKKLLSDAGIDIKDIPIEADPDFLKIDSVEK